MSTKKARRHGWRFPGRQATPPPARTAASTGVPPNAAVVLAELADARIKIIAEGQHMAELRALARIFEERLAIHPEAQQAAALAGLRARIAIFDGMWRQAQPAMGLPEPPELGAAEEVALRLKVEAQLALGGKEGPSA